MGRAAYFGGLGVAVFAALFLLFVMGAVGVLGVEGDPADRMYFGVLGIGVLGALAARLKPRGMAFAMMAMAAAQIGVTGVAYAMGMHLSPISSIWELLGVNGMFVVLFVVAAGLFWWAGQRRLA